jgi:trimethylamine--corrinoid protein Co-methyltransferase
MLSDDEVAHIHGEALRFLADHGVRVLLAEARDILAAQGAVVGHEGDDHRVRFPPELVEHVVATAPSRFVVKGVQSSGDAVIGGDNLLLLPVGGPPFVSDLDRGRRPGTLDDYESLLRLVQRTDLLHGNGPLVEPQDVPIEVRHLQFTAAQLRLSDKMPFLYTRGRRRVADVQRVRHRRRRDAEID